MRLALLLPLLPSIATSLSSAFSIADPQEQVPLRLEPLSEDHKANAQPIKTKDNAKLQNLLGALDVLEDDYFATWQGVWPTGIDWTSAVMGTFVSSALTTISQSLHHDENLVNKYFTQLIAFYFGQDAFGLRGQAYDDMLWVVLGWLETIKFIDIQQGRHLATASSPWYGSIWKPVFAHRARVFWDLASQGWDVTLCRGGMVWSPYLEPYKNAITNELYISASISMYLYFPGDDNASPFSSHVSPSFQTLSNATIPPAVPRDPKYLAAAIEGYKWLKASNMTDAQGLYVDGYHISGWTKNNTNGNTNCDSRNEMVYTYNQGVLLSGQRGLYEATGAKSYLEDGHQLVADVISATGWDLDTQSPIQDADENGIGKWHGLGRSGTLEEACDVAGDCSQDGQTFKGIFFHHFTRFCEPLPERLVLQDGTSNDGSLEEVRKWHAKECASYGYWIKHNAKGALSTRTKEGKFGMWWGAPASTNATQNLENELPEQAVDYRNLGVPKTWKGRPITPNLLPQKEEAKNAISEQKSALGISDLNDRGRGRTLETQGGGLAVLRARWELVDKDD
ncbi:hypothetical protein HYFRA_00003362 [Hymenoscyphus fraxineus]|uniref:Glycoside hydrolase family 76 protein n=1 Tax=Hymenoscyphus fraxineus TaxID=746836 RepID=A0A9N9KWB2_9HELO|nr:hypothetical protein HYFRA_00003362 [Hymenoscyphus fraxineus]